MYRNYNMPKRSCCSCNNADEKQNIVNNVCENSGYQDDFFKYGFNTGKSTFPENPMYAQSYVPWQTMDKVFMPEIGLKMGTIFPELVSPYMPGDSMKQIDYLKKNNLEKGCIK